MHILPAIASLLQQMKQYEQVQVTCTLVHTQVEGVSSENMCALIEEFW